MIFSIDVRIMDDGVKAAQFEPSSRSQSSIDRQSFVEFTILFVPDLNGLRFSLVSSWMILFNNLGSLA
jgi:hypothetical protein